MSYNAKHDLSLPEKQLEPMWFAVHTRSRHEKKVSQHLIQRNIPHFLPLYAVQRKWKNGLTAKVNLPLFPEYLFVNIPLMKRIRVLETPGVLAIVGGTRRLEQPIPDEEIHAMQTVFLQRQAEPHPILTVGQKVFIRNGPLAGKEGVVLRNKNSLRVVLTMDLIMRSIAIEVNASELEQVGPYPISV